MLPTFHGSGLFQRGETQVLNICTLGMAKMDQMVDGIDRITRKRYLHHYNFRRSPPARPDSCGGPKRREIGHGALAGDAVFRSCRRSRSSPTPSVLVSEVLSTAPPSMGSVCSSTLS